MQVREIELIERNQDGRNAGSADAARGPAPTAPGLQPDAPRVLHVFPSYGHGGVPIRIATIINHFGTRYRHTILSLDGNVAAQSRLDASLGISVTDPGIDKSRPLHSFLRIRRLLVDTRPDLLLTYNWGSIEWALVNRFCRIAPHIHLESGFGPEEADRQMPRRVVARRVALAGATLLIVPSQTLVSLARDVWRIAPGKITFIPNGVDTARYCGTGDPAAAPGFVRLPDEMIVGTVAPLRAEKNLQRLLRAFAAVVRDHNARLLIAGDGPERGGLEATAAALGIAGRVVFVGHVEQPEKVYPLMDVFAMSSDTEQMPNTLIQAMASGCPVAAVDVGDIRPILPEENRRFVVPREDETALACAIGTLLSDAALRDGLRAANLARINAQYTQERMFAAYNEAFEATMAPARTGR